ncbi:uncharacterized ABC transporter ATP-binding protein YbiT [Arthrobacter sp. Hiyo1]|nr:uncharacterized ABC transporter ATP-binding protein YbiT [Arthrobacter sp. Hiyo1]
MAHIDVSGIDYFLSDGTQLLNGVTFKVPDGSKTALIGPNGTGKTTLFKIIAGDLTPDEGVVGRSGTMGIMRQFVGQVRDESTVRDLLVSAAPPALAAAAKAVEDAELAMMEHDDEPTQMRYAQAIVDWGDAGGYDVETVWDEVCMAALGIPFDRAQHRPASSLSGGEQKRLVLEALFSGPDQLLLLDEPDNYLDVPGKRWLESKLNESKKTVFFISHDRELLNNAAGRIVTLEPGINGAGAWVHGGGFGTYVDARIDRNARFEELRKRWDEEHLKLKELVIMYKTKAAFRSDMANKYQAAQTRLAKFLEAGPPEALPLEQNVHMRLKGGRTAKRAVVAEKLELTGLMKPFSTEIWFGDRVGVLGSNGSGKSHFLRLLAAGGTDPEREHLPVSDVEIAEVPHEAPSNWVPGSDPDSSRRPIPARTSWAGRSWTSCTAVTNTVPGWAAKPLRARSTPTGWWARPSRSTSRCRVGSRRGSRSCSSSSPEPRSCSWMNPRTTWTCTRAKPWSARSTRSRAPFLPSRTTVGSRSPSTVSSSSDPTAKSTSPTSPSGTSRG